MLDRLRSEVVEAFKDLSDRLRWFIIRNCSDLIVIGKDFLSFDASIP